MRLRAFAPAALLAALALAVAASPSLVPSPTAAAFSDSATLGSNRATAAHCARTTTWATLVDSSFTGATREEWQTLSTSTSAVPNDRWNNDNWSESSLVTNQSGALYCSADGAISLDASSDVATSPSKSYASWSASTTVTTMVWVRSASTTAGRLISLAERSSGSTRYAERVLWVTETGGLVAGGRYSSSASWTTETTDVAVNDGRWHLLAVVWTNSKTANAPPTLYVDGVEATTTTTGTVTYRARSSSGTSASWYLGANSAGRSPSGAPSDAYLASYDEFLVVAGTPSDTLLGSADGSLFAAADH